MIVFDWLVISAVMILISWLNECFLWSNWASRPLFFCLYFHKSIILLQTIRFKRTKKVTRNKMHLTINMNDNCQCTYFIVSTISSLYNILQYKSRIGIGISKRGLMVINIKQNIYCFQYIIYSETLSMQFRIFMFNCYSKRLFKKFWTRKIEVWQEKYTHIKVTPLEITVSDCLVRVIGDRVKLITFLRVWLIYLKFQ